MTSLPRWGEGDGPSDPDLRAALSDMRRGPSQAELSALAERVAQRMYVRQQVVRSGAATSRLGRVLIGLASVALISSGAWWWSAQPEERGLPVPTRELDAAPQANPGAPSVDPATLEPSVEQVAPETASQPAPARVAPHAPARKRVSPEPAGSADPGDEVQLLQAARRALLARPEQALDLTQQHEARFAQGVFVEERQAIAIEALLKLGRAAQAERKLRGFLGAYPQSTYRARLTRLGAPR